MTSVDQIAQTARDSRVLGRVLGVFVLSLLANVLLILPLMYLLWFRDRTWFYILTAVGPVPCAVSGAALGLLFAFNPNRFLRAWNWGRPPRGSSVSPL